MKSGNSYYVGILEVGLKRKPTIELKLILFSIHCFSSTLLTSFWVLFKKTCATIVVVELENRTKRDKENDHHLVCISSLIWRKSLSHCFTMGCLKQKFWVERKNSSKNGPFFPFCSYSKAWNTMSNLSSSFVSLAPGSSSCWVSYLSKALNSSKRNIFTRI